MKPEIRKLADEIESALASMGFTLWECESKTTNSVYICLNHNLDGTIRVSDHAPGKNSDFCSYQIGPYINKFISEGPKGPLRVHKIPAGEWERIKTLVGAKRGDRIARFEKKNWIPVCDPTAEQTDAGLYGKDPSELAYEIDQLKRRMNALEQGRKKDGNLIRLLLLMHKKQIYKLKKKGNAP